MSQHDIHLSPASRVCALGGKAFDESSFARALAEQFLDAVADCKLEAALAMLAALPSLATRRERKAGRGALHWCCASPSMAPCAKALLALGCPVDGFEPALDDSPLRWAADAGSLEALEALLALGAPARPGDLLAACRRAHGACAMALVRARPALDPFAGSQGLPSAFEALASACEAFSHPFNEQRLRAREALAFFERLALERESSGSAGSGSRRL